MSERKEGWYWVKFVDDECAQWDGDSWFVAGMEGSVPESCFSEIGPRIPAPSEAPPIGTRYRDESGELVAVVAPVEPQEQMLDAARALMMPGFSKTFDKARRHVSRYHGKDSLASWPEWAMDGDDHMPKNARSELAYRMMLAALPEPE